MSADVIDITTRARPEPQRTAPRRSRLWDQLSETERQQLVDCGSRLVGDERPAPRQLFRRSARREDPVRDMIDGLAAKLRIVAIIAPEFLPAISRSGDFIISAHVDGLRVSHPALYREIERIARRYGFNDPLGRLRHCNSAVRE